METVAQIACGPTMWEVGVMALNVAQVIALAYIAARWTNTPRQGG